MVFEKLHKFIGKNIKALVSQADRPACLRLQKNRVFYVREDVMRRATNVRRRQLLLSRPCCSGAAYAPMRGTPLRWAASAGQGRAAAPVSCPHGNTEGRHSRVAGWQACLVALWCALRPRPPPPCLSKGHQHPAAQVAACRCQPAGPCNELA